MTNLLYIILISTLLISSGWILKAILSISQGQDVNFDIKNPLNLKARWPKNSSKPDTPKD